MSGGVTQKAIRESMGAVSLGGLVSVFLSGIVAMQVYLYIRVYPKDRRFLKALVTLVWAMDFAHTLMVCFANWLYLIEHFGDRDKIDHLNWAIGVSVALTALVTFVVHCFFTHRIHIVSKGNHYLTFPLAILALFRLIAALVSTAEMIILASYSEFVRRFAYVFTMGLGSAVALDVFITLGLSFYLRKNKSGFSNMNDLLDSLILYTVETGMVTCITTIVSLVCWVAMPHNLIFLGLHFMISKLYANSFMATLNSRATLRARSQSSSDTSREYSLPVMFSGSRGRGTSRVRNTRTTNRSRAVEISVQHTVQHEADEETNVNLKSYGGPSKGDADSSSDMQSDSGRKLPSL